MKEMNTVLIAIESDKSVVRKMELSWIMCKKGLYDEYECECVEIDCGIMDMNWVIVFEV